MVGYVIPSMRSGNAHEKPYRRMQKSKMAQYRRTDGALRRYRRRRKTTKLQNNLQTYTNYNEKSSTFVCDIEA